MLSDEACESDIMRCEADSAATVLDEQFQGLTFEFKSLHYMRIIWRSSSTSEYPDFPIVKYCMRCQQLVYQKVKIEESQTTTEEKKKRVMVLLERCLVEVVGGAIIFLRHNILFSSLMEG